MFCGNCGAEVPEGAKFCKQCGVPIVTAQSDDSAGQQQEEELSNNQIPEESSEKPDKKPGKKKKKENGKKKGGFPFWLILILILILGLFGMSAYLGIIPIPTAKRVSGMMSAKQESETEKETTKGSQKGTKEEAKNEENKETKEEIEEETEEFRVEHPDADEYYRQNSQTLIEIPAKESDQVPSEKEILDTIEARGFSEYPMFSEYTMEGEYYDAEDISAESMEKHPIYQTYYLSSSDELWTIIVINGQVMANPVSYNMEAGLEVQTLISEAETVTSYDSATNKFYERIPDESVLIVKVVNRIDAETLDRLTAEVIGGL